MLLSRKRVIAVAIFVVLIIALIALFGKIEPHMEDNNILNRNKSEDYIEFLDVGEADCTVIHSDGHTAVIDTAGMGTNIAAKLRSLGINRIDTVVLTHTHLDHSAGLYDILDKFDVKDIYSLSFVPETHELQNYFKRIKAIIKDKEIEKIELRAGSEFCIGNFRLITLYADADCEESVNEGSAVIKAECFGKSALLCADAGEYAENMLIMKHSDLLKSDIIKVGHHGSSDSATDKFLSYVCPKIAVISCGYGNSYGHPSEDTLKRLKNAGAEIYRTDYDGNLKFVFSKSKDIELK